MRAIFVEDISEFKLGVEVSIGDENVHHLINVARVKVGEEVLVLNGQGVKILSKVIKIDKNELTIKIVQSKYFARPRTFDLAIGCPKKESFNTILKMATEIGINMIYPLRSDYSQLKEVNYVRASHVMEGALIQSNGLYLPELSELMFLTDFQSNIQEYDKILFFDSEIHSKKAMNINLKKKLNKILLIIGPEGGFSENEKTLLMSMGQIESIYLPTYILRSTTAVAFASGFLMGIIESSAN